MQKMQKAKKLTKADPPQAGGVYRETGPGGGEVFEVLLARRYWGNPCVLLLLKGEELMPMKPEDWGAILRVPKLIGLNPDPLAGRGDLYRWRHRVKIVLLGDDEFVLKVLEAPLERREFILY